MAQQIAFGFASLLALLWACTSLSYPFGWDQGVLAWVGDAIHHGEVPYRDRWDVKGPLTYFVFAFAELFGVNEWAIRVVDLAFLGVAAVLIGWWVARLTDVRTGRWTALIFALWYASAGYWHTAQPDGWAMELVMAALILVYTSKSHAQWLAAGALIGCAFLFKSVYALFLPLACAGIVWCGSARERRPVRTVLIAGFGFLLPVAAMAGWFAWKGALSGLVEAYVLYPLQVYAKYGTVSAIERARGVIQHLFSGRVIPTLLPLAVFGFVTLWTQTRRLAGFLAAWIMVALLVVAGQGRFYEYHWLPIVPPFTILVGMGLYQGFAKYKDLPIEGARAFTGVCLAVALAGAAIYPLHDVGRWLGYMAGGSRDTYLDGFGGTRQSEAETVAYLRANMSGEQSVYVWGWNTGIAYLSGRATKNRFGFSMPLIMGRGSEFNTRYRSEFLRSMHQNPPEYIVRGEHSGVIVGEDYQPEHFQEFEDFLSYCYAEERQIGPFTLYRNSRVCPKPPGLSTRHNPNPPGLAY
jgi:hypothetical protein